MNRIKELFNGTVLKPGGVVPRREALLYGLGIAGQNVSVGMVGWFYYFCTDVAYYDLKMIAVILTVVRLWDAVNDPLMGMLIDRHRFKNGEKLRPWLKIAPMLTGIAASLLFIKPNFADNTYIQATLILIIYLVYDMAFTLQDISMWGMSAVMSPKSKERELIAYVGRVSATVGSWLPGLITVFISVANQIGISQKVLFAVLGIVLGGGGMLVSVSSSLAKERVRTQADKDSTKLKDNLSLLFKNRTVMLILLGSILGGFSIGIPAIYFYKYKVDINLFGYHMDGYQFNFIAGLIGGLPGTLAMMVTPWFVKRLKGMKNVLIASGVLGIVTRIICYFIGYEGNRIIIVTLIMAFGGIFGGMCGIAVTALFGDSVDYMEWKTGIRGEAIVFAAQTFSSKIGGAINNAVLTSILIALKYSAEAFDAGLPLSPEFDHWIWPLFILGPIVGALGDLIPKLFIKDSPELKKKVEAELAMRRENQKTEES